MELSSLENKKILIAPYTPLSKSFSKYLEKQGFNIVGFIDNNKIEKNVYKADSLQNVAYDVVLIYNELYFKEIYKQLKKNVNASVIYKVLHKNSTYLLKNKTDIFIDSFVKNFEDSKIYFYKFIQKIFDSFAIKREVNLFIAKESIGSNLKYLYLFFQNHDLKNTYMITNNEMELRELEKSGLKSCKFNSLYSYILASKAKNIISEQVILEYFKDISTSQKTLQLWHGVPFKKLNSVNNIEYDYFVATSDYLNKEIFSFLFKSKKYINCGYPRIDAFSDEDNLLFCDKNIYELVKNNKKNGIKTIIYVPTYRDDVESNISPIDFFKLDNFLVENNICFIVKFHHFVLEQFDIKIDDSKKYNNIVFYNSQGDIYPIIKYVDLLITDYSSIAFDYLLLNRPIIYFDYDIEEYKQSRGEFLLDYDKYTPGIKVKNQIELEKAILTTLEKDAFFNQRKELVKELFDYVDHNVSNRIFNELQIKER